MKSRRLLLLLVCALIPSLSFAESLYIKVKNSRLRSQPQQWSHGIKSLAYGEKLELVVAPKEGQGWYKVKAKNGSTGYIHWSAITDRKIVLSSAGVTSAKADEADILIAGKGFNKKIEKELASQDATLNFSEVDKMERLRVGEGTLAGFIKSGGLGGKA